eukprot:TRINITY_DN41948_c0_g1_i1.p1 TRINITY_DN41948_c0_g1~~TRINITY_DN41948_c0_g1_i1.p1  ORF type:complete len:383 (-),score=59.73 TRINITY_DN41948_c0_g1_i1:46-1194(-)
MGAASGSPSSRSEVPVDLSSLSEDERALPPFFVEVLLVLTQYQKALGGLKHFDERPRLGHKVKKEEFCSGYTDYEYIYMTVLGFARLHTMAEEISRLNNGENFTRNPGVQLLEKKCGMTMHGDRDGANALIRAAPGALLEAFRVAGCSRGGHLDFFKNAFDRKADPCLEGRTTRLMEYSEKISKAGTVPGEAPWEDVSLQPLPAKATPRDIVGEHLRVFCNECTWTWARQRGLDYDQAKAARLGGDEALAQDFASLYNASSFRTVMHSRGVVLRCGPSACWEVLTQENAWTPYDQEASLQIEQAAQAGLARLELRLGPRGWQYVIDLQRLVQLNPKTGKDRPIRRVEGSSPTSTTGITRIANADFEDAVQFYVDVQTLPAAA